MIYSCIFTYLLLIGFWSVLYYSLKSGMQKQDEDLVRDRLQTIVTLLQSEGGPSTSLTRRIEKEWFERNAERILVRVVNAQSQTIAETPHHTDEYEEVLKSLGDGEIPLSGQTKLTRFESGSRIYETAISEAVVVATTKAERYRIEIALERTGEQSILSRFRVFFFYLLVIGGLASVWIGASIVRIALAPVRRVSEIAAEINSDHLDVRLNESDLPAEFHELAVAMNGMLDRLSDSFTRLTRFSDDMAHELRTPVNNLLGSMEVALAKERTPTEYRNIIGSGIEECERLKRIIESLLFIARSADPNAALIKQPITLQDELRSIVSFYEASADVREVRLRLQCPSDLTIAAERTHLQRCIGNLLSNSIRHSPANSEISIDAERQEGFAAIRVTDRGSGIPAEALSRIGERFFRVEASRSKIFGGTGLGLSIARSIVVMHGGKFKLTSREGEGTTVELLFPI